jgi:hypothetical protein
MTTPLLGVGICTDRNALLECARRRSLFVTAAWSQKKKKGAQKKKQRLRAVAPAMAAAKRAASKLFLGFVSLG